MNSSVVSFVDPENNRTITIDFTLNPETGNLNYNINIVPEMEEGKDYGLNLYLANMFLSTLQAQGQPQEPERDNVTEKVNED